MEIFEEFGYYWFWLGLAAVLLIIEAILGRFLWLAASVGALIVGILSYFFGYVSFSVQLLFFVIVGGTLMWATNIMLKERQAKIERLTKLFHNRAYVDKEFVLQFAMLDGQGEIEIDGDSWRLIGPDCAQGERVRVLDMGSDNDGVKLLEVEPVTD